MRKARLGRLLAIGTLGTLLLAAAPANAVGPSLTVVASGLDNPRGVAATSDGTVYVAEAGRGGTGPCAEGPEGEVCYGATGAITRVRNGKQARIVTGLPSLALEGGANATGPHDVFPRERDELFTIIGLGNSPNARSQFGDAGRNFGQLAQVFANGTVRYVADIAGYEAAANPDNGDPNEGGVNSNPYSVLVKPDVRVVADAGGNSLVQVDTNGKITTLAVFPERLVDAPPFLGLPPGTKIPMQAVPTSVAIGRDGSYFVGELTGFPFPVGGARVYKVTPGSTTPEVYAEGFTNIVDVAFDDGNLYVLELVSKGLLQAGGPDGDLTGALIKVAPDGTKTTIASTGLIAPGGMAIAPGGVIYVSNKSVFAGGGELLRIQP